MHNHAMVDGGLHPIQKPLQENEQPLAIDAIAATMADYRSPPSVALRQLLAAVEGLSAAGNEALFAQCFQRVVGLMHPQMSRSLSAEAREWVREAITQLPGVAQHVDPRVAAELFSDIVRLGLYRENVMHCLSRKAEACIAALPELTLSRYVMSISVACFPLSRLLDHVANEWKIYAPFMENPLLASFFYASSVFEHPAASQFGQEVFGREWSQCDLGVTSKAYIAACGLQLENHLPPALSPETNRALRERFEHYAHGERNPFEREVEGALGKILLHYPDAEIESHRVIRAFSPDFLIRHHTSRIALECDGSRGHFLRDESGAIRMSGNDMLMERILSRDSWTVVRIRRCEWDKDGPALLEQRLRQVLGS